MRYFETVSENLNKILAFIAGVALVGMMILAVVNMVLRVVYVPFGATAEVIGWLAALTTALSLGYTQIKRAHVSIDILVSRFPLRVQAVIDVVVHLFSVVIFSLAAWQMVVYGARLKQVGSLSETLRIAHYPIIYLVAFGLAVLSFVLLVDFVKSLLGVLSK